MGALYGMWIMPQQRVFLRKRVYRSFIHRCQNWEARRCLRWMDKSTVVHPDNWIVFIQHWKNELLSHENTCRNLKCISLSERSQSEKATYTLYYFNYMTFWKRQNTGDSKKIGGCQGLGWRMQWRGRAQRISRAAKLLCVILQWWRHVTIHLSNSRKLWALGDNDVSM